MICSHGYLLLLSAVFSVSHGISKRTVYTVFRNPKTWNEASAICTSQFGQLVKIQGDGDIAELQYLLDNDWSSISITSEFWTGLHDPFNNVNTTREYQDCQVMAAGLTFTGTSTGRCSTFSLNSGFVLYEKNCSETHMFICQRYEGDCWYEPFEKKTYSSSVFNTTVLPAGLDESDCAVECRSRNISNNECWGFMFDQTYATPCKLLFLNEATASSTFLSDVMNNASDDDIFYVRRCFEGDDIDTKTYSSFVNANEAPNTDCDVNPYSSNDQDDQICFCSTQEKPPIPEPISSEEKAEKYAAELAIDNSNTSAATRKLSSAEDNRPSAVGVGMVGVGLLSAVFGGLVLLDLNVLISGIQKLFCSKSTEMPSMEGTDSDC